jgi:acyl carrier protein
MDKIKILKALETIMQDIFDVPTLMLTESSSATDVEEWDSLNHVQMVVAVEKHFKIKFTAQEIQSWKNAGEICETIQKRVTKTG